MSLTKHILLLLFIVGVCYSSKISATNKNDIKSTKSDRIIETRLAILDSIITTPSDSLPQIYEVVEQMPQFPGGETEMIKFFGENLRFSKKTQESGIQGRVIFRFIITETGEVKDIETIRTPDSLFSQSYIDVIKAMPKWEPGKQNGKAVPVYFTLGFFTPRFR